MIYLDSNEFVVVFEPQQARSLVSVADLVLVGKHTRCSHRLLWPTIEDAKLQLVYVQTHVKSAKLLFTFLFVIRL